MDENSKNINETKGSVDQDLAGSCKFGVNDAGTSPVRSTPMTQAGSRAVHPFSSDITALDSQSRKESDPAKKLMLLAHMQHLKNGTDRPNGKRYIGRQIAVSNGTYKPPKPEWLNRRLHLDAE